MLILLKEKKGTLNYHAGPYIFQYWWDSDKVQIIEYSCVYGIKYVEGYIALKGKDSCITDFKV